MDRLWNSLPPVVREHPALWAGMGVTVVAAGYAVYVSTKQSARATPAPAPLASEQPLEPQRRRLDRRVSVAGESFDAEAAKLRKRVFHYKTAEAAARIRRHVQNLLIFRGLDAAQVNEIVDAMHEVTVEAGVELITQGDEGDNFYIVDKGSFDIVKDGNLVAVAESGSGFGELALLYSQPRAATVKAREPSVVWALDRDTFRSSVVASTQRKRKKHEDFLRNVELFEPLEDSERAKLADVLDVATFAEGERIVTQGDSGQLFYIIEEGEVAVTKKGADGVEKDFGRLGAGKYFGEIALIETGYRAASVTAIKPTSCLVIDKSSFNRLLGPCIDILKRNIALYDQIKPAIESN